MPVTNYRFCETAAGYVWHIRKISSDGLITNGGLKSPTLCGAQPTWDIKGADGSEHAKRLELPQQEAKAMGVCRKAGPAYCMQCLKAYESDV